jgi:hypothetical protein
VRRPASGSAADPELQIRGVSHAGEDVNDWVKVLDPEFLDRVWKASQYSVDAAVHSSVLTNSNPCKSNQGRQYCYRDVGTKQEIVGQSNGVGALINDLHCVIRANLCDRFLQCSETHVSPIGN